MDEQLAIFFFAFDFLNIIPVILGRWEEDKYKTVCNGTATWLVHVLHVPSEGRVASMYVLAWGGGGVWMVSGHQGFDIWLATQQVTVFLYATVIGKYPWGARACEICETMALSILYWRPS